jgi:replicative DNA helicase
LPSFVTPNASLEAELATIGAMLMSSGEEKQRGIISRAHEIVAPEYFSMPRNQSIVATIYRMFWAEQRIDYISVAEALRGDKILEEVGGASYLSDCMDICPSAANIETYAGIVRDAHITRESVYAAQKFAKQATNGIGPRAAISNAISNLEALQSRATAGQTTNIMKAADLCALQLPEPRWAVPNLIPEGLTVLAGKPKMGKSWLALQVALAVSCGGVVMGSVPVKEGDALYLALEDSQRRLQSRIVQLMAGQEVSNRLDVALDWPRLNEGGLEQIERWIKNHHEARIVVIDTLQKARPAQEKGANAYAEDYDVLGGLQKLASRSGVAIVVVHHTTKGEHNDPISEVSGTLGITGAADGIAVLKRKRNSGEGTLFLTGRDMEEQELAIEFDSTVGTWTILGDADERRLSDERTEIIDYMLHQGEAMKITEVAKQIGKPYETIKSLMFKMEKAGDLVKVGYGTYVPAEVFQQAAEEEINDAQNGAQQNALTPLTVVTPLTVGYSSPGNPSEQAVLGPINVGIPLSEGETATNSNQSNRQSAQTKEVTFAMLECGLDPYSCSDEERAKFAGFLAWWNSIYTRNKLTREGYEAQYAKWHADHYGPRVT